MTHAQLHKILAQRGVTGAPTEPGWYVCQFERNGGNVGIVYRDHRAHFNGASVGTSKDVQVVNGAAEFVERDLAHSSGGFFASEIVRHAALELPAQQKAAGLDELYDALAEVPARVDRIVHLRTMVIDWGMSDVVDDLFDGMEEDELRVLLPQVTEAEDVNAFLDGDVNHIQDVIHKLKIFGFVVQLSTPIVNKSGGYSWGYTTGASFYADTYEDALRAGLAWARKAHEEKN